MKNTEASVLRHLARRPGLTPADRDRLVAKLGKDQKKSRARDITTRVEGEYAQQYAALTQQEKGVVRQAVQDYTNSSDTINTDCRQGNLTRAVMNIDQAFTIYHNHGFLTTERVVYRLMSYKPANGVAPHLPYGAANAPRIVAGDLIYDLGFISSSENRQLLVNPIKNAPPGTRYVKFVIVGQGGMNISGGGTYTNANEQLILQQHNPRTHYFRTAHAGQAEILFPRGLVMRIKSVTAYGNDFHVSAVIPNQNHNPAQLAQAGVKNSYTGT